MVLSTLYFLVANRRCSILSQEEKPEVSLPFTFKADKNRLDGVNENRKDFIKPNQLIFLKAQGTKVVLGPLHFPC